jgi:hypothetical protein
MFLVDHTRRKETEGIGIDIDDMHRPAFFDER